MIKILIIVFNIISLLYIIYALYKLYVIEKEIKEQDYIILKLEERIETYKWELYGRINAIKYNIPDNIDIKKLRKKVNNGKNKIK